MRGLVSTLDALLLLIGFAAEAAAKRPFRAPRREDVRWLAAAVLVVAAFASGLAGPQPQTATAEGRSATNPVESGSGADVADGWETASAPAPPPVVRTAVVPAMAPPPAPIQAEPVVPVGKGMWLHVFGNSSGGDPHAIVRRAHAHGLTHLYVRLGSSKKGFYAGGDLDRLLPVAHAANLKVVGWDFPYLDDPIADAQRAAAQIAYRTPGGHGIDAFSADIETPSEGTNLTTAGVVAYGSTLRQLAGPKFPLIAAVPRPNGKRWYPYAEATQHFDAIAPMVYWINRDPVSDLVGALNDLAPLGKPILPVGQAYDPAIDGSHSWEPPSKVDIYRFLEAAAARGVASVSFWVWDKASPDQWLAIAENRSFDVGPIDGPEAKSRVAALQRVLSGLGHKTAIDGDFGVQTQDALTKFQAKVGVPVTGQVDAPTLSALGR